MTDAELLPKPVVETRKGSITAVWVAALPKGQTDKAQEIKVILRSTRCKEESEIAQKFQPRATYRGAVVNPLLLQPHDPYRPLLQDAFPNLKLAPTIWEVDIDYDKPSEKWASGFYTATGVLAIVGAICGAVWFLLVVSSAVKGDQPARAELQGSLRE